MINVKECIFEDKYVEDGFTTYYFIYPKELGMTETGFYPEEDYGDVVSMCISMTVDSNGVAYLQMSPTVNYDDCLTDEDWRDLYVDENYTHEMVKELIEMGA